MNGAECSKGSRRRRQLEALKADGRMLEGKSWTLTPDLGARFVSRLTGAASSF